MIYRSPLSLGRFLGENLTLILSLAGGLLLLMAVIYIIFRKRINALIAKYREVVLYVLFGGLTTAVNFAVFYPVNDLVGEEYVLITNFLAWTVSVAFAFVTNKLFVFRSKEKRGRYLFREIYTFVGARVFSLLAEEAILAVFAMWLSFNEDIVKLVASAFVVVLNYFFSKFIVFKKQGQ